MTPRAELALDGVAVPPFDAADPRRNVNLFGAERNAMIALLIYEGWSRRFYLDGSVPIAVRERLMDLGADVVLMPAAKSAFSGLFWRFLVAGDPGVDRYLIRDADSVVNVRERVPVDSFGRAGAFPEYGRRAAGRHVGQDDFVRGAGTAQRDQAGRLLAVPTVTF